MKKKTESLDAMAPPEEEMKESMKPDTSMEHDEDDMSPEDELREEMEELHERAKQTYLDAFEAWKPVQDRALEDLKFYSGEQWAANAEQADVPIINLNRLPMMVKQIEAGLRDQEMAINAAATDEEGSDETANILTSMIKGIEARSNARAHIIRAAGEQGALVPGFGWLYIDLDYTSPDSFDQEIWIKSVRDPFSVIPDPNAEQPDFSDGSFWFTHQDYTKRAFKMLFPDAELDDNAFGLDSFGMWRPEQDLYRVIRYWYKKEISEYTFLLDDGSVVKEEEVDDWEYDEEKEDKRFAWMKEDRKAVLRQRKVMKSTIHWVDFTGAEILDEGEWIGEYFPYVGVTGPSTYIEGKRDIRGLIRYTKDSQKMLNFLSSQAAQRIAQSTKSPYIMYKEQIAGFEKMWNTAHKVNRPYLLVNSKDPNNSNATLPFPQRSSQAADLSDLMTAMSRFDNDVKATMGMPDAVMGMTPGGMTEAQSGVAIKTLSQQGQNANSHHSDNLVTALKTLGCALMDLIPKVYSEERVVRSVSAEGQERLIRINQMTEYKGEQTYFDIRGSAGHYGVNINVGPANATQKQAAIEQMTELARVNPNMMPYVQDELVRNMDFEGKDRIADRLLAVLQQQAPGVVQDDEQPDIPPQVRAQMGQMQQQLQQATMMIQQLQQQNQQLTMKIETKQIELQGELQLEEIKQQGQRVISQDRRQSDEMIQGAQMQIALLKQEQQQNSDNIRLIMDLLKTFGPVAGTVAAELIPQIDATIDQSYQNQSGMAPPPQMLPNQQQMPPEYGNGVVPNA